MQKLGGVISLIILIDKHLYLLTSAIVFGLWRIKDFFDD